ncbi:MAG: hypothetical protein ACI4RT_04810 [Candidatus Spyradenecus sp.]
MSGKGLYGSDVISVYINEKEVCSALCEDGTAYQISCDENGYTNYSRIY